MINRVFGVLHWYHWLVIFYINLTTNGTIAKEIGANCKNGKSPSTDVTNVTTGRTGYHWANG